MQSQYSLRSPAVKRLMREAQELKEATETYHAQPLEDNLFEWHFTIRGPEDTEFEGGIFHGRIILPPDYPMKPPSIIMLTPNGRFETYKKICLSISGHHPESWQPSWSIRTALLAIIGFMPTHGNGAIGSLDYTPDERKVLARRSMEFKCQSCGPISCILKPVTEASKQSNIEAKQLAQQINFQGEKDKKTTSESKSANTSSTNSTTTSTTSENTGNPFPQVNMGNNPFGMMPPFMNPMFNPQTTTAQSGSTGIPPQMFMPPYWPPNMMPPQPGQNSNVHTSPLWPPGNYNFMMPSTSSTTTVTSAITQNSSLTTPTNTADSSVTSDTEASTSSANTTSQAAVETSSQQPVSSTPQDMPSTNTTESSGLRQRAPSQARIQHSSQPADLPTDRRGSHSSRGGCTLWLMIIVGLALILLILRRLIMMELLKFDISY